MHAAARSPRRLVPLLAATFTAALLLGCDRGAAPTAGRAIGRPAAGDGMSAALRVGGPGAGLWSPKVTLPLVPAAAANLPDGKVLLWSSDTRMSFGGGGKTYTAIFDPATGAVVEHFVTATAHDMFCPGTTNLPDGRLLVNGGVDSKKTSLFDPATGAWTAAGDMNIARGYNANTILPDGSVLTLGGSWSGGRGGKHAELWTEAAGWRRLPGVLVTPMLTADAGGVYRADNHMWLVPAGNGLVLHAGPSKQMNWIDPRGDGRSIPVGNRADDVDSMSGITVMYDAGKILKAGGSESYENVDATAGAYAIDVNPSVDAGLTVRKLAPMAYARAYHNAVVLPNGQVVIVGGQTRPVPFSDDRSVLVPELWDPATEAFTPLPELTVPRNYHSIAMLLPDGRVLAGGGGLCGGCTTNHPDLQILTPPYLLNADGTPAARPSITAAPAQATYGAAMAVTTSDPVAAFALVRMGSTTHTVNNDQRRIPLAFEATGPNAYAVAVPTNPGLALPGAYMLFALDADGVPSVATSLKIGPGDAPRLVPPGDQVASVGAPTTLAPSASAPGAGPITFGAHGLPPGLRIDAGTGVVSGTPTAAGLFPVTLTAQNAAGAVSTDLRFRVVPAGSIRFVKLEALSEINGNPWSSIAELDLLDPAGNVLPRGRFQASADSAETVSQNAGPRNALDGATNTIWHTAWSGGSPPPPHTFVVDLGGAPALGGFRYLPRQDASDNGLIKGFRFYVSADGVTWGNPVAEGDFTTMGEKRAAKTVRFSLPVTNRAPTVTAPSARSDAQGETVAFTIAAADPDGDRLTFFATGLPPGLAVGAGDGIVSGTLEAAGVFDVALEVQDDKGESARATFVWTVTPTTKPIVGPVLAPPATAGAPAIYAASATGTGLSYRWDFGDGSAPLPFAASPSATHTFAAPGLYTVTLTVQNADLETTTRAFTQAVVPPVPAGSGKPTSAGPVAVEPRPGGGARLWVVNPDADSVTVFELPAQAGGAGATKLAEIPVGTSPTTLAIAPGGEVWVANRRSASVSVVDPATLAVTRTLALPRASQPFGIAFAPGGAAYVTLAATGRLVELSSAGAIVREVEVGPNPRLLAVGADGRVLVARFLTPPLPGEATAAVQTVVDGIPRGGEVVVLGGSPLAVQGTIVLRHSEAVDSTVQGRGVPNYLGAPAVAPDGRSAWVPSKQDNVLRGLLRDGRALDFQNTVRAISSRVDLEALAEDHAARVDHDNSGVASAAAFHPSGAYLFVALETSRQLAVVDPVGRREILRLDAGRAPQGLVVAPDGLRLFVSNFMDRTVGVYDLTRLVNHGEARVPLVATLSAGAAERLPPNVLAGKRLFYDARDGRLARDGYVSCAACHRDGEHDGRTWDLTGFGEGLRNTISLRGRAGAQGRLHWSGNFDEVQDFEGQIRALAGGTGLLPDADLAIGTRSAPLGDPKAGVGADLDALAAYVNSLGTFDPSPHRTAAGALTAAAAAGQALFASRCAGCHGGAGFTNSALGRLEDVGTIAASSGKRLGEALTGIDVPTLRDAWATAPYLHDGRAATVADAIRAHDAAAVGGPLGEAAIAELAAYVQQVGGEEPGPPLAVQARFAKLEQLSEVGGNPWGSMAELDLLGEGGAPLPRTGWVATADSEETTGENGRAANAIDGDAQTIWHTAWQGTAPPPPHALTVDLGARVSLRGFRYLPRQSGPVNGTFARFRFFVSRDGVVWGAPVSQGDFGLLGPVRAAKTVALE